MEVSELKREIKFAGVIYSKDDNIIYAKGYDKGVNIIRNARNEPALFDFLTFVLTEKDVPSLNSDDQNALFAVTLHFQEDFYDNAGKCVNTTSYFVERERSKDNLWLYKICGIEVIFSQVEQFLKLLRLNINQMLLTKEDVNSLFWSQSTHRKLISGLLFNPKFTVAQKVRDMKYEKLKKLHARRMFCVVISQYQKKHIEEYARLKSLVLQFDLKAYKDERNSLQVNRRMCYVDLQKLMEQLYYFQDRASEIEKLYVLVEKVLDFVGAYVDMKVSLIKNLGQGISSLMKYLNTLEEQYCNHSDRFAEVDVQFVGQTISTFKHLEIFKEHKTHLAPKTDMTAQEVKNYYNKKQLYWKLFSRKQIVEAHTACKTSFNALKVKMHEKQNALKESVVRYNDMVDKYPQKIVQLQKANDKYKDLKRKYNNITEYLDRVGGEMDYDDVRCMLGCEFVLKNIRDPQRVKGIYGVFNEMGYTTLAPNICQDLVVVDTSDTATECLNILKRESEFKCRFLMADKLALFNNRLEAILLPENLKSYKEVVHAKEEKFVPTFRHLLRKTLGTIRNDMDISRGKCDYSCPELGVYGSDDGLSSAQIKEYRDAPIKKANIAKQISVAKNKMRNIHDDLEVFKLQMDDYKDKINIMRSDLESAQKPTVTRRDFLRTVDLQSDNKTIEILKTMTHSAIAVPNDSEQLWAYRFDELSSTEMKKKAHDSETEFTSKKLELNRLKSQYEINRHLSQFFEKEKSTVHDIIEFAMNLRINMVKQVAEHKKQIEEQKTNAKNILEAIAIQRENITLCHSKIESIQEKIDKFDKREVLLPKLIRAESGRLSRLQRAIPLNYEVFDDKALDEYDRDVLHLREYRMRKNKHVPWATTLRRLVDYKLNKKPKWQHLRALRQVRNEMHFNRLRTNRVKNFKKYLVQQLAMYFKSYFDELKDDPNLDVFLDTADSTFMGLVLCDRDITTGRRAIATIALRCGLHKFKPSPIYFMQEIDKGLNEEQMNMVLRFFQRELPEVQILLDGCASQPNASQ